MFENMCIFQLHVRVHVQENKNEHVASSCCALALSPSEVLKEVKVARMRAFKQMSAGYEMGMKECPNCKQIGLFVHDANQAKCVHPDHERICAELIAKADEEAASAARRAKEPTKRGCSTCGCWAMMVPGCFRPAKDVDEDKAPHRCERHACLDPEKMEIACGGRCDGCMQVTCRRCDRCKCYQSEYSISRCKDCLKLHEEEPDIFPLHPAFPPDNTCQLLKCGVCKKLEKFRTNKAEQLRREERQKVLQHAKMPTNKRQKERIILHLRKWKAECARDNLRTKPPSKDAARRLASVKADAGYCGNMAAWKYLAKKFFQRQKEVNRKYDKDSLDQYLNIPDKYK